MCRGPHEWSTRELEANIQHVIEVLSRETTGQGRFRRYWEGRLKAMEKLLKERAEAGII